MGKKLTVSVAELIEMIYSTKIQPLTIVVLDFAKYSLIDQPIIDQNANFAWLSLKDSSNLSYLNSLLKIYGFEIRTKNVVILHRHLYAYTYENENNNLELYEFGYLKNNSKVITKVDEKNLKKTILSNNIVNKEALLILGALFNKDSIFLTNIFTRRFYKLEKEYDQIILKPGNLKKVNDHWIFDLFNLKKKSPNYITFKIARLLEPKAIVPDIKSYSESYSLKPLPVEQYSIPSLLSIPIIINTGTKLDKYYLKTYRKRQRKLNNEWKKDLKLIQTLIQLTIEKDDALLSLSNFIKSKNNKIF